MIETSGHLPECRVRTYTTDDGMVYEVAGDLCICPALRACERRVLLSKPNIELSAVYGYEAGRSDGLSAARDAVAGEAQARHVDGPTVFITLADALAAIDALRGNAPHLDPCDCDDCRTATQRAVSLEPQPDTPTEPIVMYNYEPPVGSVARCTGCGNVYVHKDNGWVDTDDLAWGQPWSKIRTSYCGPVKVIYKPEEGK